MTRFGATASRVRLGAPMTRAASGDPRRAWAWPLPPDQWALPVEGRDFAHPHPPRPMCSRNILQRYFCRGKSTESGSTAGFLRESLKGSGNHGDLVGTAISKQRAQVGSPPQ